MPIDSESIEKPWSPLNWDVNGDGAFTVADLGGWLREAYFLPGDWSIWLLAEYRPEIARFFELDTSAYGGLASGLASAFLWLAAVLVVLVVARAIKRFDEALTNHIRIIYDGTLRRLRIGLARLRYRMSGGRPRNPSLEVEFAEGIDLGPIQRAVLKTLLDVPAPYALSVNELAQMQHIPRAEVAELVKELKSMKLVSSVDGGAYEDRAYTITSVGRAYVLFDQLGPSPSAGH